MTDSISNYSIYCNTENVYVNGWGISPPTTCYNNNSHSVDETKISTIETIINVNANSTSLINKYQIYCNTESDWIEGWSNVEPTTCYNNTSHSVNLHSVQELESVSNSQVKIIEDTAFVARNVKIVSVHFENVQVGETQIKSYKFEYITSMYSYKFATDDTNKGDEISIAINPQTPLGLITADITAGDTIIYAPAALFTFGWVGFNIYVSDGTNFNDLGEIINIDKVNNTITVKNPAVNDFSSNDTILLMTYYNMKGMKIGPAQMYAFGEDVIGGAAVPVGTEVQFSYKNNQIIPELDEPKTLTIYLTLLF